MQVRNKEAGEEEGDTLLKCVRSFSPLKFVPKQSDFGLDSGLHGGRRHRLRGEGEIEGGPMWVVILACYSKTHIFHVGMHSHGGKVVAP